MSIQNRIKQYIDYKNITAYKFCKDLGLSLGYLDKKGAIGTDKYLKIIEYYPDLNHWWLLTGKGEMLVKNKDRICLNSEDINVAAEPQASYGDKKKEIIKKIVENNELILKLIEN